MKFLIPMMSLALGACALTPPPAAAPAAPPAWVAKLPGGGPPSADWWARFDDPLLAALITQADSTNPGLQQVLARIEQARALARQAGSAQLPQLSANAFAQRAKAAQPAGLPVQTLTSASLDAGWEIDLFGRVRQQANAAQARAEASVFDAQAARLSLAAEVAQNYLNLRACERLAQISRADADSTAQLAGFTQDKLRVGLESPANAALLQAASADAAGRHLAQQADCDLAVKGLVALTTLDEAALRAQLPDRRARLPETAGLAVAALPAESLARRPDLAAGRQQVIAAWAERGAAEAARYPQLQLSGSIGLSNLSLGGGSDEGRGWSFGPTLSLPLFDGGLRRAQADAAQARYDEALAALRSAVFQAVREVEEALVRLDAARQREGFAQTSAEGYRASFTATESRWRSGLASAAELEDARRLSLAAQAGLVGVQRDRLAAWIALFKATGGDWTKT